MILELFLGAALAGPPNPADVVEGTMAYKPANYVYPEAFEATAESPAGMMLTTEYWMPMRDSFGRYVYSHRIVEFRYDDGDVIMIQTSPNIGGRSGKRNGWEFITLAYGCDQERKCDEEYHIKLHFLEGGGYYYTSEEFEDVAARLVDRTLRQGATLSRRVHREYKRNIRNEVLQDQVLAETISVALDPVLSARDVDRIYQKKDKLESYLDRSQKDVATWAGKQD